MFRHQWHTSCMWRRENIETKMFRHHWHNCSMWRRENIETKLFRHHWHNSCMWRRVNIETKVFRHHWHNSCMWRRGTIEIKVLRHHWHDSCMWRQGKFKKRYPVISYQSPPTKMIRYRIIIICYLDHNLLLQNWKSCVNTTKYNFVAKCRYNRTRNVL